MSARTKGPSPGDGGSRSDRSTAENGRLQEFNALLGRVEQAAAQARDALAFLDQVCGLAVRLPGIALAWVGVPDPTGRVVAVASAGATAYLDGISISVRSDTPLGGGPTGRAWNEGRPQYVDTPSDARLAPWARRMRKFGFTGVVGIPVVRGKQRWGVLDFYLSGSARFTPDVQLVLEDIGRFIGLTLDRIDADSLAMGLADTQRLLLEHTEAGLLVIQGDTVVVTNRHLGKMLGNDSPEALQGTPVGSLLSPDADLAALLTPAQDGTAPSRRVGGVLFMRSGRDPLICDVIIRPTTFRGEPALVWTVHDVSERVALEADLARQAFQDALTGLPNRRALDAELPRALARAKRQGTALAVGMLDMDDFKVANDALGHEGGDRILSQMAGRLRARLRASDFIARPGGDEFVILFEGLGVPLVRDHLACVVDRLRGALEEPLVGVPVPSLISEMSLGIAVYPGDGETGEELLRKADATLYTLKGHKGDRQNWWRLASEDVVAGVEESSVEPYGEEASTLLARIGDVLESISEDWIAAFHAQLSRDPSAAVLLDRLPPADLAALKVRQAEHMAAIFRPDLTREDLFDKARRLGETLCLVGVGGGWLTRANSLYRDLLTGRLNQVLLSSRERYRLLVIAAHRLQDEQDAAIQGMQAVDAAYLDLLAQSPPAPGTRWADASRSEMELLSALPGIMAVLLLRLGVDGAYTLEHAAGSDPAVLETLRRDLRRGDWPEPRSDGAGLVESALGMDRSLSVPSIAADRRLSRRGRTKDHGPASLLVVPVLDESHHATAGLVLCGRHPNQFESPMMKEFAKAVERRWESLWSQASVAAGARVIPEDMAREWRRSLFSGDLEMYVQPVVDLRSGHFVGAEALARLRRSGGEVTMPGEFLPLLGDVEMARLFRLSLDQALAHAGEWKELGLPASVSVNLPPATLLIEECREWVSEALERHGADPADLLLELLETRHIDQAARDRAIARLVSLGVHLAIDDLGSGFSSLMRLAALPLHVVKIDRGLVQRMKEDPLRTFVVLDALIRMTGALGRKVVAEGMEDLSTLEAVAALGAPWGQGYAIAFPMPAKALPAWYEGFRLPSLLTATTYLGALAHHWKGDHPGPVEGCPLAAVLARPAPDDSQAREWHRAIHGGGADAAPAAADLTRWLSARAMDEAGSTPSSSSHAAGA